ncbi:MAG: hypothetical protein NZU63_14530 [Gemmataceae bacterium]|nr:hypothetical protein [Gemmataceae bacterium]MDW8243728.1 hypothetical protein [Thermogemmata sp.]
MTRIMWSVGTAVVCALVALPATAQDPRPDTKGPITSKLPPGLGKIIPGVKDHLPKAVVGPDLAVQKIEFRLHSRTTRFKGQVGT